MVLGSARWDRNDFSESNLHVYGRDGTKAGIYNMERCTKTGGGKKIKEKDWNSCTILLFNKTL